MKTDEEKIEEVIATLDNDGLEVIVEIRRRKSRNLIIRTIGNIPQTSVLSWWANPGGEVVDSEAGLMLRGFQFIPDVKYLNSK